MMPDAKYRAQWRAVGFVGAFILAGAVAWPHSRPLALACFYAGLAISAALTWRAYRDDRSEPVDWPNDVPRSHVRRIDEEAA
jgi:hypothetical protein